MRYPILTIMSFSSTSWSDFPENHLPISLNFVFPSFSLWLYHPNCFLRWNQDVLKRFPSDLLLACVVWFVENPFDISVTTWPIVELWFYVVAFISIFLWNEIISFVSCLLVASKFLRDSCCNCFPLGSTLWFPSWLNAVKGSLGC